MMEPGPDLAQIRTELARVDGELIASIGDRMRCVRAVASFKAREGYPAFDRDREAGHLEDLARRADALGIPRSVVRDVFGVLFAASRGVQRRILAAHAERFSVGIVGGTAGMGAFLARLLVGAGYPVETSGLGVGAPPEELASRHDLVILAVPISVTCEVAGRVGPRVRPGACLADVTSVKRAPLSAMMAAAPEGVDVVGTHPMFGPQGDDMDRQKVVLCRGRGEPGYGRVKRLFELFGAETVEATPEEHDSQMALIQVLVHEKTMVLGSVLERLGADLGRSRELASPIYRAELAMIGRLFSQAAELYVDILTSNDHAAAVSRLFVEEAARFAEAVERGDRAALVARFRAVAGFLTDFAAWAKDESNAILADLVRHG